MSCETTPPACPEKRVGECVTEHADAVCLAVCMDGSAGVWVVDENLVVTSADRAAAAILMGAEPADLVGNRIADLVPSVVVEWVSRNTAQARELERPHATRGVWNGRRLSSIWSPCSKFPGSVVVVTRPDPAKPAGTPAPERPEPGYVHLGELDVLTPRELEVLAHFGRELTIKGVAERMHRSSKTIEHHRESIGRKLGLTRLCEIVSVARDLGLEPAHAHLRRIKIAPVGQGGSDN